MDDLSGLIQNIISALPQNTGAAGQSPPQDAPPPINTADANAANAAEAGNFGNFDISGLLNSFSPHGGRQSSNYAALLTALKPYLRADRRRAVERVMNLTATAYSIRAVLSSLDLKEGVRGV